MCNWQRKLAIKRTIKAPLNIYPPDNNHEGERQGTSPVKEKVKTNTRTHTNYFHSRRQGGNCEHPMKAEPLHCIYTTFIMCAFILVARELKFFLLERPLLKNSWSGILKFSACFCYFTTFLWWLHFLLLHHCRGCNCAARFCGKLA